jgi:hypothetical protein
MRTFNQRGNASTMLKGVSCAFQVECFARACSPPWYTACYHTLPLLAPGIVRNSFHLEPRRPQVPLAAL